MDEDGESFMEQQRNMLQMYEQRSLMNHAEENNGPKQMIELRGSILTHSIKK